MTILILLFVTQARAAFAIAKAPEQLQLQFKYEHQRTFECSSTITVRVGEEYLACEGQRQGRRLMLRTSVTHDQGRNFKTAFRLEEISEDGQIRLLDGPSLGLLVNGSESSMWTYDEGRAEESMRLEARLSR